MRGVKPSRVANSVLERTRELGIRTALGATTSRVVGDAAVPGLVLASVGIAIGLLLARVSANALAQPRQLHAVRGH